MYYTFEQKIEIIKKAYLDGWSTHIAFRKARSNKYDNEELRKHFAKEIQAYNERARKKYYRSGK